MKLQKKHFDITDGLRAMDNLGEKGEAGPRLLLLHLFRRNDDNVSKEHNPVSSTSRESCAWMELFFGVSFLCSHQLNCVLLSAQPPNTAPALCSRSFGRSHPAETWGFLALRGSRNVCSTNSFGQLLQCWAVQQCHAGVRPRVPPAAPGHGIGDTASDVALEPGVASAPLPCFLWQLLQSLYFCQPFTPLGFQASQFSLLGK